MTRPLLVVLLLILAAMACTFTSDDNADVESTPTTAPIPISEARTATAVINLTTTPAATITVLPTALPTLQATPVQFRTPTPLVFSGNAGAPAGNSGSNSGNDGGSGEVAAASSGSGALPIPGDAASGAPQSGGFYFPNTIVFNQGGSIRSVGRDGGGGAGVGSGSRIARSLNGLYVATVSGGINVARPDGRNLAQGSGQTTLPTWSRDGQTAYWGSGSTLVRSGGGGSENVDSVNGNLTVVEAAPDGSSIVYASQNQIKILRSDGSIQNIWESGETITNGPFWTYRGDTLGLYFVLNTGRRIHWSPGGLSDITDPNVQLELRSPANGFAHIYVRSDNGGSLTLIAVYPGGGELEFTTPSLADVSWSPDGSQFVYASTGGELVLADAVSGAQQVIASGGIRNPVWTTPQYRIR